MAAKEPQYNLWRSEYTPRACSNPTPPSGLLQNIKRCSIPIPGSKPAQYKLKFLTTLKGQKGKFIKCCVDYGFRTPSSVTSNAEKVIIVVGATGAGKTTLINGFANYVYGVQWGHDFRLRVINESADQSDSQTKRITAYTFPMMDGMKTDYSLTIIDTPGFGDTGGIERDREISADIKKFFSVRGSEGIDQLHGVLFVTPAAFPRLTPTQMYVFEAVLGIFGNDIKDNIFLMTTFADGQKPQVLNAVKKAKVPYKEFFKFNNSALYAEHVKDESDSDSDEDDEDCFDQLSWKMGIKSFEKFFRKFAKVKSQSLVLTREVMHEREHLQLILKEMPKKITKGLSKIDELQQEETVMRSHESDVIANKNFTYKIKVTKQHKVDLKGQGIFVTNCLICNYTCHDNCIYANDCDKYQCSAMVYNADKEKICCGVCTKKCGWKNHVNNPYMYREYDDVEERTSDELRKRYEAATSKKTTKEQIIDGIKEELRVLEAEVIGLIQQAKKHLQRLHEIALRPINVSEMDYIDLLIEQERNEAKRGFMERIKALEGFRKQAELITTVDSMQLQAGSVFEQLRD